MSLLWVQWAIVAVVVFGGGGFSWRYVTKFGVGVKLSPATPDERRATYQQLQVEGAKLSAFDTPEFLLTTAIDLYDRKHSAMDSLDDKAQKLVALVGGGTSVFALLGGFSGGIRVALTPLLVLSALCFFGSLVLLLVALRPVETDLPAITEFNSVPILAAGESRARIARRLIEAWQGITYDLTPVLRRKGRYIFFASILIVLGASVLLANFLLQIGTKPVADSGASAPAIHCTSATDKSRNLSLTCEGMTK